MHAPLAAKLVKIALRNVLRNWRHSLATLAAIASGFTAVGLFDGFLRDIEQRNNDGFQWRGMMGHVIVQRQGAAHNLDEDFWAYSLTGEELAFLDTHFAADPDFQRRVRFLSIAGLATGGRNNAVFMGHGYDVKEGADLRGPRWMWNTVAGKPLSQATTPSTLLGVGLGRFLDCETTYTGPKYILPDGNYVPEVRPFTCKSPRITFSATTESAQVNAVDLEVVGLFDAGFREADKRAVSMPLEQAQRLLDTDKATMVSVQLKDDVATDAFLARLKKAAADAGYKLDAMRWNEHRNAEYIRGGVQILHVFRNLFMTVVVTIGVMSVANTMMKSVAERTREIGTLRSIGFLRRHLIMIFSMEGAFLSVIACAAGLVMTIFLSWLVGAIGVSYRAGVLAVPIDLRVAWAPSAWLWSTVTLSLLATGTAWFCSRRAARMVIADAMRHV